MTISNASIFKETNSDDNSNELLDMHWMHEALELAEYAASLGEVPIGAVVVFGNRIIGRGYNLRETVQDPTLHAEVIAIREASRYLGSWRLIDCSIYVTLEPCPMCAGALVNARLSRCVFGASDQKAGAVHSLYELLSDSRLNHRVEVVNGCLADSSSRLLSGFFKKIRAGFGKAKPCSSKRDSAFI